MPTNYKEIAEANTKKYGTDIGRYGPVLLAHLYSDRTHFIYEILQNAEDAGAKEIKFHLLKDRLEVQHNGRLFDSDDVRGICGLVEGTKKDDLTQIGKFGIGFKSVYAYTNTPKIYSGDEAFCIKNYVLPYAIDGSNIQDGETLFVFPFDHTEVSPEQAFNEIAKRLGDVGTRTLLFLNHIEEISWRINGGKSGNYIRDIKVGGFHKKVYVISKIDDQSVIDEEWLVFERPLKLSDSSMANLRVEVAFKIGKDKNGKEIIMPTTDSKLIVFFPTEKPTYLNFLIQGPYKTTPNRENIPLDDEQNKVIVRETGVLISECISFIKMLGYLDVNFLTTLPLDSAHGIEKPIYSAIFGKVKEKLLSDEELLPTHDRLYTRAKDALLARGKDLTEILDHEDTDLLFSRRNWLSTDITYDRTRELRDYLIDDLGVDEIDFEDFARNISSEFLEKKNDKWMVEFYARLLDQRGLWRDKKTRPYKEGILRTRPIIRLADSKHAAPYDDEGNLQVFLPTEYKSEFKTVKKELLDDKDSLGFLKELGLHEPDIFAEISKNILPKYLGKTGFDEGIYFEDFEKVLTFFKEADSFSKKEKLVAKLSETPFILSTEEQLRLPYEIYLNANDLKEYFEGYDSAHFVSQNLCDRFDKDSLILFLKEVKVSGTPRRKKFNPNLSNEELGRLRNGKHRTSDIDQYDFDLEGLDNFLGRDMSLEKSLVLWNLILRSIEPFDGWKAKSFFEGSYSWRYYSVYNAKFDSAFLTKLQKAQWLVSKDGSIKKASEITFSELANAYPKEIPNINVVREKLHFKPDVFDQLPDDFKNKLELTKERSPEEIQEALALLDKQSETKKGAEIKEESWVPDYEPDDIEVESEIVVPEPLNPDELEGQADTMKGADTVVEDAGGAKKKEPKEEPKISAKQKKEIGYWGERSVLKHLRRQYQNLGTVEDTEYGFHLTDGENKTIEVFWLNLKSEDGKGYDFVIREDGIESEYIEVKTKLGAEEELIEITGTQWKFARKLFDQNEGDKYWIYAVFSAGQSTAKIKKFQNPIRLWKDGRLYAHPVRLKL